MNQMQTQILPNISNKSPNSKLKTLDSILNGQQIKLKTNKEIPFKTLPNNKTNISFLRNDKPETKQDQYYSSPLLTRSQIFEVENYTKQNKNDFYSQMLTDNPYKYNEYIESDADYNKKVSDVQVNLLDIKNKEKIKEFLQESISFSNKLSTHTQRIKKVNVLTQRQDVIKLAQWLDYSLSQIIKDKTLIQQQQLREIEKIFNLSLKELVREISLDCVEKSVLLEKIWNQYVSYNTFLLKSLDDERNSSENEYLEQIKSLHQTYQNSVNFLEEKLKQIDDEFNQLSIKFERKKIKLRTIRGSLFNISEQKKDLEQEVEYLKIERRDLLETKESLQTQVEQLTQENEKLQIKIFTKAQELRTAKTKRYSQVSLDSCCSEYNHKGTTTEDFCAMMSIQKDRQTQTQENDVVFCTTAIQTDIKFIFHQGSQTGNDEDEFYTKSKSSSFFNGTNEQLKKLQDQKLDLEEKLKLSNNIISDLQKTKQHLQRECEISYSKLQNQDISLSALQKELERLQQELQSILHSRQQKKRTIISLDDNNGEQMSLGPLKDQQSPLQIQQQQNDINHQNKQQKLQHGYNNLEQQNQKQTNNKQNNEKNTTQTIKIGSNQPSQNNSQNQTPLNKNLNNTIAQNQQNNDQQKQQQQNINNQQNHLQANQQISKSQQQKQPQHQKKQSETKLINSNSKTKIPPAKKPLENETNSNLNSPQNQFNVNLNSQNQKTDVNIPQIQQVQVQQEDNKDQLNSSLIRNELLNLNDPNNEEDNKIEDFAYEQGNQNEQKFLRRASTKKLSYKFNSQQISHNNSIFMNSIQRKGSNIITSGPDTKTIREKEQFIKEAALEFMKQFVQNNNLQHPDQIEQTMQLQNVLKLISQFYKERLDRKQPIYVICYDFYMHTFGLKQIAENKLTMFCQAVVYYRKVPRVKLFSRFLQIVDGINDEDVEFYFTSLQQLDPQSKPENLISCQQNQENILVPYEKALDLISSLDEQIVQVQQKLKSFIIIQNGMRIIDLDLFFMESLDQFQLMKKIHQDNFKELFEAVDVNDDKQISLEEFTILYSLLEENQKKYNISVQKFKDFCGEQEGLSFYQFGMFCLNNKLFKKDKQENFLQYNKEKFQLLQIKWNDYRKQITQRMKQNLSFTEYYQNLVRKLDDSLKQEASPTFTWLLWRILDEQSRRLNNEGNQ